MAFKCLLQRVQEMQQRHVAASDETRVAAELSKEEGGREGDQATLIFHSPF